MLRSEIRGAVRSDEEELLGPGVRQVVVHVGRDVDGVPEADVTAPVSN